MMQATQATFFTPSYIEDLERAIWMRRSLNNFFNGKAHHIIAVPRKDIYKFRQAFLQESDLTLVAQEDFIDPIFYPKRFYNWATKLFPSQAWRLARYSGKPGWIIQQIVKLNCTKIVKEGAIIFLDSDLFFFRPFDFSTLGIENNRLLLRRNPADESSKHRNHITKSREILALPQGYTEHHYMAHPAIWYADWLLLLHRHIEQISGKKLHEALYDAGHISEYSIYGTFIEEILKPTNLVIRDQPYHIIVWNRESFNNIKSKLFDPKFDSMGKISLVIQSNIGIPVTEYNDLLQYLLTQRT